MHSMVLPFALLVETGTTALSQPVEQVQVRYQDDRCPEPARRRSGRWRTACSAAECRSDAKPSSARSCSLTGGRQVPSVVLEKYSGSQSARSRLGLSVTGRDTMHVIFLPFGKPSGQYSKTGLGTVCCGGSAFLSRSASMLSSICRSPVSSGNFAAPIVSSYLVCRCR